jgi:hypothetical protein
MDLHITEAVVKRPFHRTEEGHDAEAADIGHAYPANLKAEFSKLPGAGVPY